VIERNVDGLVELFAKDATFVTPDGREFAGVDVIRAMYTNLFALNPPLPNPIVSVVGPRSVATEIEGRLADGTVRKTANFFHLNDAGLIQRLSVYTRAA
jgi:hypothetical protein